MRRREERGKRRRLRLGGICIGRCLQRWRGLTRGWECLIDRSGCVLRVSWLLLGGRRGVEIWRVTFWKVGNTGQALQVRDMMKKNVASWHPLSLFSQSFMFVKSILVGNISTKWRETSRIRNQKMEKLQADKPRATCVIYIGDFGDVQLNGGTNAMFSKKAGVFAAGIIADGVGIKLWSLFAI